MNKDRELRKHLHNLLNLKGAHVNFEQATGGFPEELRGKKPDSVPYSAWQLLEHIRIAQWDIVEFSLGPDHTTPAWPEGFWPKDPAPLSSRAWEESIQHYKKDLNAMQELVADPETDLYARIPWGTGQTILREAMLVSDHTAYHLGQMVLLRKLLGVWH